MKNCIGGCKKERQSILETQHVRKVHDLLDQQKKDETIESLLQDGGLEVWKQWVRPMLDNKKIRVGSAKAYLSSLSKFCEFIVDHHENEVRDFLKVPSEIIKKVQAVAKHFKGTMSAVTKQYGYTKWDREMEEEDRAVPVSVIENIMETEAAKEAHRFLTHTANEMFLSIRDYIIARLEVENCQ